MVTSAGEKACLSDGYATALIGASPSQAITMDSNRAVKRLPDSAHNTAIC